MTKEDGHKHAQDTPAKQSRITRFLPARKAREQAAKQISTPAGKRTRGGLVSAGSPDQPGRGASSEPDTKSPEHKRSKPSVASSFADNSPKHNSLQKQDLQQQKTGNVTKAEPAFQRFAHLLEGDSADIDRLVRPHLPLPAKYQLIIRLQQALDSAIVIAGGRGQRPVWHRLVPALQSTLRRTLAMDHLRLLRSFVDCYRVEPCKVVERGRRVDSVYIELADECGGERARRDLLFNKMLLHVEREHAKFLEHLNIVLPRGAEVRNWHPKFDLEAINDPTTEKSNQEQKPVEDIPSIIKAAIESVAGKQENPTGSDKKEDTKEEKPQKLSLKERIRLKERQAAVEKMTGSGSSKHRLLLSSLPDLIDTLSFLFASSKKSVLFLNTVQERLRQSMSAPWSVDEVEERLEALHKYLPEWISIIREKTPFTVRIDKSILPKVLKERLAKLL